MNMSLFTGVDTARSGSTQLPKLSEGTHEVTITKVTGGTFPTSKGTKFNAIITEYTVDKSGNAADPVGAVREYCQGINDFSLGDIQNYAAACAGVDPRDKEKVASQVLPGVVALLDAACSPEQVFSGVKLVVNVGMKSSKKDPSKPPFKVHTFFPKTA